MLPILDHDLALPRVPVATNAGESDLVKLARLVRAHTPHDGSFELCIPGVRALRMSRAIKGGTHSVQRPSVCIVSQGAKRVILGPEVFDYDASRLLVISVDLPITSMVTQATPTEPFLGFRLDLAPSRIADLTLRVYPHGVPPVAQKRGVYTGASSAGIINAAVRLLELIEQPDEAPFLAPLVIDEILIRLLRGPLGARVAQIGRDESKVQRIARAVAAIRANYDQAIVIEDLADMVHMSVSSFHEHFKTLTSMSPLQYLKVLRLQEARRLMLSTMIDAQSAGQQVGYLSASQFSREYSRFFGDAPTRDIARLREERVVADH